MFSVFELYSSWVALSTQIPLEMTTKIFVLLISFKRNPVWTIEAVFH